MARLTRSFPIVDMRIIPDNEISATSNLSNLGLDSWLPLIIPYYYVYTSLGEGA